ncbi:hypothetical protein JNK13_06375 [bacterium]|nr:hypothetical protein [bacterium]
MIVRNLKSTSGNIAFYALACVPFVVTLSVLAVDVSHWSALREHAQSEAERIAMQAVQALPDQAKAQGLIQAALARQNILTIDPTQTLITQSSVQVGLEGKLNSAFDFFVEPISGAKTFTAKKRALVQLVPTDYVLIIADGRTLRPEHGEDAWGNSGEWPASGYWNCATHTPVVDARWSTQSCYNPAFTPLKLAALSLVDVYGAIALNRVGAMFTPGTESGVNTKSLRFIRGEITLEEERYFPGQIGGFINPDLATAEAHFDPYRTEGGLGDEACVFFADSRWDLRYQIPATFDVFGFQHAQANCQDVIEFPQCHLPFDGLSSCYLQNTLRLREAIYWHAAKLPIAAQNFTAEPEIISAIERAVIDLVDTATNELLQEEIKFRGNVGYKNARKIILLTDRALIPDPGSLTRALKAVRDSNSELYIVAFDHPFLTPQESSELNQALGQISTEAQALMLDPQARPFVQIFQTSSSADLEQNVIPRLIALGREVAIRS